MMKTTAIWTNFSGAPGYTNFFYQGDDEAVSDCQQAVDRMRNFFGAFPGALPGGVQVAVQPNVQVINPATGQLQREVGVTAPAVVAGGANAPHAAGVGACVIWRTSTAVRGRLLKGRTFVVPLAASSYDNDGTIVATVLNLLRTGADGQLLNVIAGPRANLGVWTRPTATTPGAIHDVTGFSVRDKTAVLRSRRD